MLGAFLVFNLFQVFSNAVTLMNYKTHGQGGEGV